MRKLPLLSLAFALASSGPALAATDSLMQTAKGDGKTFIIHYLHSKEDGTTVVEDAPVTLVVRDGRAGPARILFDGPTSDVQVRWSPEGLLLAPDAKPNHEKGARLQLVLHGEFVVEVSNGKQVHVKPGEFLLQEDSTGFGHKMHCDAPKDGLGCIQLTMDAVDPAAFFKNVQK